MKYIILAVLIILFGVLLFTQTKNPEESNDTSMNLLTISSSAFEDGQPIPQQYTCDGANINPPLSISGVPNQTTSLVLIMEDPDVPKEVREDQMFNHWVVYNMDPDIREIPEDAGMLETSGVNSTGEKGYIGPCPPTAYEPTTHRYFFKLFALDDTLDLDAGATKQQVEELLNAHTITSAELVGTYDRTNNQAN